MTARVVRFPLAWQKWRNTLKSCPPDENWDPFHKCLWIHIEISWTISELWFWLWWCDLVIIFHMSGQLSCRDMCKIVNWSDHIFYARARRIFLRFRLRTHKYFIKWISDCWSGSNREVCLRQMKYTNLCHAGFVWENMRLLLHFMWFIGTGMVSRCWNLLSRKTNS